MRTAEQAFKQELDSPLGRLTLLASDQGLQALLWPAQQDNWQAERASAVCGADHPVLNIAAAQVQEYFAGARRAFEVPLDPVGTPFQRQVWGLLAQIPYGQTTTYGQLAQALGNAGKAQAVGAANGRNPISIIVPCHRVIGQGGQLTGFAGGLDAKAYLLELEGHGVPPTQRPPQQGDLFG